MIFDIEKGARAIMAAQYKTGKPPIYWKSQIISHSRKGKIVVRYTMLDSELRETHFLGKFYDASQSQTVYLSLSALKSTIMAEASSSLLFLPEPILCDAGLGLVVYRYINAKPYDELILQEGFKPYLYAAGQALATLHSLNVSIGNPCLFSDHLRDLVYPEPKCLGEAMPIYKPVVDTFLEEMQFIEAQWGRDFERTVIHRDFHLRQLFYQPEKVVLIDWDLAAMGDPVLDVGNFIVYLETHFKQDRDAAVDAFLEGYFLTAPILRHDRIFLYKAFSYLRLACKGFRLKENDWQKEVHEMLRRCETSLLSPVG